MVKENGLHTRAILVNFTGRCWTARKFDRKASKEVTQANGAVTAAARVNKHLLAGADDALSAVTAALTAARNAHYEYSLPWSDRGWRLLPTSLYLKYTDAMRDARARYDAALDAFLGSYEEIVDAAQANLGALFDGKDYPSLAAVRRKFGFDTDFSTVPEAGDLRIDLAPQHVAMIEADVRAQVEAGTAAAMQNAWGRLFEVTAAMVERLSEPDHVFRDSLVGNVRSLVGIIDGLNITDDPDLARMAQAVAEKLATFEPETLRKDQEVRATVAREAQSIIDAMSAFYAPVAEEVAA